MTRRSKRSAALAAVLAAAGAGALAVGLTVGSADAASAAPKAGSAHGGRSARLDHIFVIMLENHGESSVIGDPHAPYINQLAHSYGTADHYYGVTHPSMPNYLAALGGDTFGVQDDVDQNISNLTAPNLVDQLESHGRSWSAYMDSLPSDKQASFGPVVGGQTVHLYARKHDPFVLFSDVADNPGRMAKVKSYDSLSADLASAKTIPDFVWISPNQCNDMHGGVTVSVPGAAETPCPYANAKNDPNDVALKQKADVFVHRTVEAITHSPAWSQNSAIFIVADENDWLGTPGTEPFGGYENAAACCDSPYVAAKDRRLNPDWPDKLDESAWPGGVFGGGLVPAIVVTSHGPRGIVSHTPYNHYSLLRTVEDNWDLGYLRLSGDTAGGVRPMTDLLRGGSE